MRFYAHVNPESALHIAWRNDNRAQWWAFGVEFIWNEKTSRYESAKELNTTQIDFLRSNTNFVLEAHTTATITTTTDAATGKVLSETMKEE